MSSPVASRLRVLAGAAVVVSLALLASACGGSDPPPRPDLLFVSSRDGDYALYAMNADGRSQERLTPDERGSAESARALFFQVDPAWSPDGTRIAFVSRRKGSFDVWVMNADGSDPRQLTSTEAADRRPTWSPDGQRIAFERDESDLVVMNADGSDPRTITGAEAAEMHPAWSPDGEWIAYVRRLSGTEAEDVWLVRPDGSDEERLTALRAKAANPAWSPDSQRVAFVSNARGPFWDLYVRTVGEKGVRRLTASGLDAFEPAWSPDGETIAFSREGSIVVVDLDGNEKTLTKAESNDSSPAWNPVPPPDEG